MITLRYRLVGSVNNPTLTKQFNNRHELDVWVKAQGNILIQEIESTGSAALSHIFG